MSSDAGAPPDRRKFLLGALAGVTAVGGAAVGVSEWREAEKRRAVRAWMDAHPPPEPPWLSPTGVLAQRRRLGRTGLEVGVVGIGAGGLSRPELVARAVDKGIDYLDTSTCYGASEDVLGRALRNRPDLRQKLVIATKWDPGAKTPKERILESLDASLKRIGVDHVDVMQLHWLGSGHRGIVDDDGARRLENPELYEAMEIAKKAGKVRFFGATSHDAQRSALLRHAIAKKVFDVLLVKMNVLDFDSAAIPALLAEARRADVGVVAMKSQPDGGRMPPGFEKSKYNVHQANLRWVLAQEGVATVVVSTVGESEAGQDAAIGAAHEPFGAADRELLERYADAMSPEYCRGCDDGCHDACPDGVAVAEVLRYRMYDAEYGWPDRARRLWASLPAERRWSDRCLSCDACSDACPFGVDAADRVRDARRRLG